jgi:hypothetical protein
VRRWRYGAYDSSAGSSDGETGVLLPLPFRDPGLVWVGRAHRDRGVVGAFSPQDFDDLARGSGGAFGSLADYSYFPGLVSGLNLTGAGEPLRIPTASVSGAFFTTTRSDHRRGEPGSVSAAAGNPARWSVHLIGPG